MKMMLFLLLPLCWKVQHSEACCYRLFFFFFTSWLHCEDTTPVGFNIPLAIFPDLFANAASLCSALATISFRSWPSVYTTHVKVRPLHGQCRSPLLTTLSLAASFAIRVSTDARTGFTGAWGIPQAQSNVIDVCYRVAVFRRSCCRR